MALQQVVYSYSYSKPTLYHLAMVNVLKLSSLFTALWSYMATGLTDPLKTCRNPG